jgi:predicted phage-related endonuclease
MTADAKLAQWLADRDTVCTASDAGGLLGVDSNRSLLDIYARKTGLAPRVEQTEQMWLGSELEETIVRLYRDREGLDGRTLRRWPRWTLRRHPTCAVLACTPDVTMAVEGEPRAPVEIKATSQWWGDEPPVRVQLQLQVQIACLGARRGWIVALERSTSLRAWEYDRHDAVIDLVVRAAETFWRDHIEPRRPPWPDETHAGMERHAQALALLYPESRREAIRLPAECDDHRARLVDARARKKLADHDERAAGDLLRRHLGESAYGVTPSGSVVGWIGKTRRRLVTPERLPRDVAAPEEDS